MNKKPKHQTKHKPKFKVGDRLLFNATGRQYDAVVISIKKGTYLLKWFKTCTDIPHSIYITSSITCLHIDKDYILYDSPEGIWARI